MRFLYIFPLMFPSKMDPRAGLEPTYAASEAAVLPLDDQGMESPGLIKDSYLREGTTQTGQGLGS